MSKNVGGRPSHYEGEIKKAAIALRTAPSIHAALKVAAAKSGRSVTQEVEARLQASFDRDAGSRSPETEQLLNRIAAEVTTIESMTGKHWHKDRLTSGAVLEMLEKRAKRWIRTDDPYDDEIVQEAWSKLASVREERKKAEDAIEKIGLPVHSPTLARRGGVFGNTVAGNPSPLNALLAFTTGGSGRWREREALEKMEMPDQIRQAVVGVIEHLERLDAEEAAADEQYGVAVRPYIEAELQGRKRYIDLLKRRAQEAMERGAYSDAIDWM